jgi:hypothetical protein
VGCGAGRCDETRRGFASKFEEIWRGKKASFNKKKLVEDFHQNLRRFGGVRKNY